jgi:alpha-glucosidase
MTQEGIRGDEESPDNSMVLNTLFTRMIAGAGDHTNCYFAPRVQETMGSHASQLAKAVCIYSPWQFLFWYDRPKGSNPNETGAGGNQDFIRELPELTFFDCLPTVWDDTRVLEGYPGKFAVVARKSGDLWFVGVINGPENRNFDISLDFLDKDKKYKATVFSDDASLNTSTNVRIEKIFINSSGTISRKINRMNGLAIILEQVD